MPSRASGDAPEAETSVDESLRPLLKRLGAISDQADLYRRLADLLEYAEKTRTTHRKLIEQCVLFIQNHSGSDKRTLDSSLGAVQAIVMAFALGDDELLEVLHPKLARFGPEAVAQLGQSVDSMLITLLPMRVSISVDAGGYYDGISQYLKKHRDQRPSGLLVRTMYIRPEIGVRTMTEAFLTKRNQKEEIRRLQRQIHVIEESLWETDASNYDQPVSLQAAQTLRDLATDQRWFVRLYAARIMDIHRKRFEQADLIKKLQTDPDPIVRSAVTPQPPPTTASGNTGR